MKVTPVLPKFLTERGGRIGRVSQALSNKGVNITIKVILFF